jgi:hypothetical protein
MLAQLVVGILTLLSQGALAKTVVRSASSGTLEASKDQVLGTRKKHAHFASAQITYDGRSQSIEESNVRETRDLTPTRLTREVLTNVIPDNVIPAFAFESKGHMERMVVEWGQLRDVYDVNVTMRAPRDDQEGVKQAFKIIENNKPNVAVWLMEYKDGKGSTLKDLAEGFERTKDKTRHIVFHWSPEFCDQETVTFQEVAHAYEHAAAVFQFAYQDERLASLDNRKYSPWPLGPAWWKGWVSPYVRSRFHRTAVTVNRTIPTTQREHLASFRGAVNTHAEIKQVSESMASHWHRTPDVVVEDSGEWMAADSSFSQNRYRELLETSMYGLNLAGHNPNCYRVVELIESGAIPVIVARKGLHECYDNWSALYGHPTGTAYSWIPKAPIEVLQSWDQLPDHLEEMLSKAEARGSALEVWYKQWRQSFTDAFGSHLSPERQARASSVGSVR